MTKNFALPTSPEEMLKSIKQEVLRRKAMGSLYEFVKQSWHVVEPGIPFIESWHIQAICEHLEAISRGEITRLLVNIPPRHSKSTIVSVMWPAWEWIAHPEEKFLCASYSGSLSIRDNLKTRRLIQSNWYQDNFGHIFSLAGDQNAKQRFENDKTGYRLATSVGGTATGEGGSKLILDDPHGAQAAQSDTIRANDLEWFDMVWSTRLNNPKTDAMVVVMQRLHEKDISGHIINDIGGWEHICIPAEWDGKKRTTSLGAYDPREKKNELICPERFGQKEIDKLKQLLGVYGTAGQLQQTPSPASGGIIKTKFFKLWPADQGLPQFEYIIQSYDTAFTEKTTGDPTGCTVWGVFPFEGKRQVMLLDAWDEHLGYPELRKKVVKDWSCEYGGANKNNPWARPKRSDRIIVEAKASGQSLLQDLRLSGVPAIGYNPLKADKVSRAHQAAPILEMGVCWIPESGKVKGSHVTWANDFIAQLSKFPRGEHDEYVDTFSQVIIYLKNEGWFEMQQAKQQEDVRQKDNNYTNPYAA